MPKWTNKEENFLEESYGEVSTETLLNRLPRHSKGAICRKASQMQITQDYSFWSDSEKCFLALNCRSFSIKEIALKLNRTMRSVKEELSKLKLYCYEIRNSKNYCVDCGNVPGGPSWNGWWVPEGQRFRSNLCKDCAKEYFSS